MIVSKKWWPLNQCRQSITRESHERASSPGRYFSPHSLGVMTLTASNCRDSRPVSRAVRRFLPSRTTHSCRTVRIRALSPHRVRLSGCVFRCLTTRVSSDRYWIATRAHFVWHPPRPRYPPIATTFQGPWCSPPRGRPAPGGSPCTTSWRLDLGHRTRSVPRTTHENEESSAHATPWCEQRRASLARST